MAKLTFLFVIWAAANATWAAEDTESTVVASTQSLTYELRRDEHGIRWQSSVTMINTGRPVSIRLINFLSKPHPFELIGVLSPVVVYPGESRILTFTNIDPGVYPIRCLVHPDQVELTLAVE